MTDVAEKIPFAVEISRMIELLAAQIYPSPFALLRENVQNSFDALLIRQHEGQKFEPRIEVMIQASRVRVADNGVGMSRDELRNHFWKAGSSSKNTAQARAAGVVGTFGIGAMANFGIAEELTVVTESFRTGERTRCRAQRSTLSVTESCIDFAALDPSGQAGTEVTADMQSGKSINVAEAVEYISSFVRYLKIPVSVNGQNVSGQPIESAVPRVTESWRHAKDRAEIGPKLTAAVELTGGVTGEVRIDVSRIERDGRAIDGRLILRQGQGSLRTFRNGFGLATVGVSSFYNLGGIADFLFLQPTAGREALTTESLQALQRIVSLVDDYVSFHIAARPESNSSAPFVQWAANRGRWDLCGHLRVRIEPGESTTLADLASRSQLTPTPFLVYAGTDQATTKLGTEDRPLVLVTRGAPRHGVELTYLRKKCKIEEITDQPRVLNLKDIAEYTLAESGVLFRLSSILANDYFLNTEFRFGTISHGLPVLVTKQSEPVQIVLDPNGNTLRLLLDMYDREYVAFGHMLKDFVRNTIFPRVSQLVPSATRQGAEAFLKSIQRTREIFEYEADDLQSLTSLWKDYIDGKITISQATSRSNTVSRGYQYIDRSIAAPVRDVVPDVVENEQATMGAAEAQNYESLPPIHRLDIETERKLLTIGETEPTLKGYRCFLAMTDRIREERGDFFLQPHRTSIVWGGQKALFIFQHHSGKFGLYYDIQTPGLITTHSGGGPFETCTIVMKNRIFIPIPEALEQSFVPNEAERKRLEVRCDILYIDRG